METRKILAILVLALGLMVWQAEVSEAGPMGTAFTYQGHLYDANHVADGLYDFQFKLYDANSGGSQIGSDVNIADEDVIDALFTVELDFGSGVFDGNAVWLEISVRPGDMNDPNVYTTLSPRQEVTPVPYALQTRGIFVDNDGNVGIGTTTPSSKLDVTGDININSVYKIDAETVLSNVGLENIFVGVGAGANNTTGYYNTFIGFDAGNSNTTGYWNSAVGWRALSSNTTGHWNSAMGLSALDKNTTGSYNSAVGFEALRENTTGGFNSAVGVDALRNNTEGNKNLAMGYWALYSNTTGNYNSAVGAYSLKYNTEGIHNSAVGYHALWSNTTGEENSAMGCFANYYNQAGSRNTIIGYEAGYGPSPHNKSGNVFLGYQAGYNETGDNKLYIENSSSGSPLIYGEFDNDILVINGDVGIGTASPSEKLDVNGKVSASAYTGSSPVIFEAPSGTERMRITDAGDVGIGTPSPGAKLEVNGQIKITDGSQGLNKVLTSDASGLGSWETLPAGGDNLGNHIATQNIQLNNHWLSGDGGNEGVYVLAIGDVGIGTASPSEKLDVNGKVSASAYTSSSPVIFEAPSGTERMRITDAGDVGIGTTNPNHKLDVAGYINSSESYKLNGGTVLSYAGDSILVGYGAGVNIDPMTGWANAAVGHYALYSNTIGMANSAVGFNALRLNTAGDRNTALGYMAGYSATGNGNVFLGYRAGANEAGSNNLYIANSDTSTPLIYGEFDNGILVIDGNVCPAAHKGSDLGKKLLAWDDIYYDQLHNEGSAAFTDRIVTREILQHPPKAKKPGMFDYMTKTGLEELDPYSLPEALHDGVDLLTDEFTTYNYKANYEQQVQIEKLLAENDSLKQRVAALERAIQQSQFTVAKEVQQ